MNDADTDLDAYYENLGHDYFAGRFEKPHRCPPDMPPCPDCQATEEEEDSKEYGDA